MRGSCAFFDAGLSKSSLTLRDNCHFSDVRHLLTFLMRRAEGRRQANISEKRLSQVGFTCRFPHGAAADRSASTAILALPCQPSDPPQAGR